MSLTEFTMYDETPMWRLAAEVPRPGLGRRHIYLVARVTNVKDHLMATAFVQDDGRWTQDIAGAIPLHFVPEWFGEAPVYPPWPSGLVQNPVTRLWEAP